MFEAFLVAVGKQSGPNRFWPVRNEELLEAEETLGVEFPSELRAFFIDVGSGFWAQGTGDAEWDRSLVNRIPSPKQIADLLCDGENPWRPSEGFLQGAIPFFDLGENTYLVVFPEAGSPSEVCWPDGKQIVAHSVQQFFRKLEVNAGFFREI